MRRHTLEELLNQVNAQGTVYLIELIVAFWVNSSVAIK